MNKFLYWAIGLNSTSLKTKEWHWNCLLEAIRKLLLTCFILASGAIIWIIYKMIKSYVSTGLLISISVICAGAIGNIIDCVFYGKIFSLSTYYPPPADIFLPQEDMPLYARQSSRYATTRSFTIGNFNFFPAIFNIADASITVGLFVLILFYYKPLQHLYASFEKEKSKQ